MHEHGLMKTITRRHGWGVFVQRVTQCFIVKIMGIQHACVRLKDGTLHRMQRSKRPSSSVYWLTVWLHRRHVSTLTFKYIFYSDGASDDELNAW